MEDVDTTQQRPVQIRLLGIDVAIEARIERPFHDAQRCAEAGWEVRPYGVCEVVAEDEVGAWYGFGGGRKREVEGDAVEVVFVGGVGEIWACFGGVGGEA